MLQIACAMCLFTCFRNTLGQGKIVWYCRFRNVVLINPGYKMNTGRINGLCLNCSLLILYSPIQVTFIQWWYKLVCGEPIDFSSAHSHTDGTACRGRLESSALTMDTLVCGQRDLGSAPWTSGWEMMISPPSHLEQENMNSQGISIFNLLWPSFLINNSELNTRCWMVITHKCWPTVPHH